MSINKDLYNKGESLVKNRIISQNEYAVSGATDYRQILSDCIMGDNESRVLLQEKIKQILREAHFEEDCIEELSNEIYINNFGLGPIDDLVFDDSINEIWVNGYKHIWIEKGGEKIRLPRQFKSNKDIERVMRQMLSYDKKEINQGNPQVESKLLDGSRLTFIIPPISKLPYINIRKFKAFKLTEENVLDSVMNETMLQQLKILYKRRANVLIIGETSSGKTSLMKFLYNYVDPKLRIGTIESNFELELSTKYPDRNIFEYETHDELGYNLEKLFKLALRSSPDEIWLGEARDSAEAELLLKAMRRGHPGSTGSFHTNSPYTAIEDLYDLIMEDGKKRDPFMLKDRIVKAIDVIIQMHRYEDKKRRIASITEVVPEGSFDNGKIGQYSLNELWKYDEDTKMFKHINGIKTQSLIDKMKLFGATDEEVKYMKKSGEEE